MRDLTPLCKLAIKYSTDKGGRHNTYNYQPCHGTHEYTPIYWDLLHHQRFMVKSVLEIGINQGCSLRMWEEFFPHAQIVGLDIDPSYLFRTDRIACFQADQSDPASLGKALELANREPYDLIIDDGSHQLGDQATSLMTLGPWLSDIGAYVIEDIPASQTHTDVLLKSLPPGLLAGVVYPPLGTGEMWPEALFIATKEPK